MSTSITRREFLNKTALALTSIPFASLDVCAKTNISIRSQLQYQDTPKASMDCRACLEFIAGKTDKDSGLCKVIPGDDEISPNGYCIKWNSM